MKQAAAESADDELDELIEVSHDPETGATSVKLDDVTGAELAGLALVALIVLGLAWVGMKKAQR